MEAYLDHYTGPTLHDGTVPITPLRCTWSNSGVQCSRPLKLAWAVTIHKSQGLTLDKVVVDVGKKEFCCGLQSLSHNRPSVYFTIHFPALDLSLPLSNSQRLCERKLEDQRLFNKQAQSLHPHTHLQHYRDPWSHHYEWPWGLTLL